MAYIYFCDCHFTLSNQFARHFLIIHSVPHSILVEKPPTHHRQSAKNLNLPFFIGLVEVVITLSSDTGWQSHLDLFYCDAFIKKKSLVRGS